jgi:hypothetical protein
MTTRKELAKMAAKAAAIATYNSIMGVTKTAQVMSTPDPDENNVRGLAMRFDAKNIAEVLGSQGRAGNVQLAKTEKPGFLANIEKAYNPDFASKVGAILTGKGI